MSTPYHKTHYMHPVTRETLCKVIPYRYVKKIEDFYLVDCKRCVHLGTQAYVDHLYSLQPVYPVPTFTQETQWGWFPKGIYVPFLRDSDLRLERDGLPTGWFSSRNRAVLGRVHTLVRDEVCDCWDEQSREMFSQNAADIMDGQPWSLSMLDGESLITLWRRDRLHWSTGESTPWAYLDTCVAATAGMPDLKGILV